MSSLAALFLHRFKHGKGQITDCKCTGHCRIGCSRRRESRSRCPPRYSGADKATIASSDHSVSRKVPRSNRGGAWAGFLRSSSKPATDFSVSLPNHGSSISPKVYGHDRSGSASRTGPHPSLQPNDSSGLPDNRHAMSSSKTVRLTGIAKRRQSSRMATATIQGIRWQRDWRIGNRGPRLPPSWNTLAIRHGIQAPIASWRQSIRCARARVLPHCAHCLGVQGMTLRVHSCPAPAKPHAFALSFRRGEGLEQEFDCNAEFIQHGIRKMHLCLDCRIARFSATGAPWKFPQFAFAGTSVAEQNVLSCQASRLQESTHPFSSCISGKGKRNSVWQIFLAKQKWNGSDFERCRLSASLHQGQIKGESYGRATSRTYGKNR